MALEKIETCPVCNGTSFNLYLNCKDNTATSEEFSIVKCSNCNLLITSPRPDGNSIGKYYQSNSYISHTSTSKSLVDKIYLQARKLALKSKKKLVLTYSQSGSLLDYGCGTGHFINTCKDKWETEGIEPSPDAREKAIQLTGVKIYPDTSQLSDNQYDIITLWHVLEHVHLLNQTLENLIHSLKSNGTIFIAVPNCESWDASEYKEYWAAYDVPRHLWHFSKNNMVHLLTKHGLKLERIVPMKLDAYYVSLLSEQYKNPKAGITKRYIDGFLNGLISNIKARKKTNHSSLIYIAKR